MFFHEHEKHDQVFLNLKDGSISQSDKGNSNRQLGLWDHRVLNWIYFHISVAPFRQVPKAL